MLQARPRGPACHLGTASCFNATPEPELAFLARLSQIIDDRFTKTPDEKSYTAKLIASGTDRIVQKVGEEAVETVIAAKNTDPTKFADVAADLLFHLMVLLRAKDKSLAAITDVLRARHTRSHRDS